MARNYFWLPYYDETWRTFLVMQTGVKPGARLLPAAQGDYFDSGAMVRAQWNEIQEFDSLQIATHGRKYTTASVAWVVGKKQGKGSRSNFGAADIVTWTPAQMASVLFGFCRSTFIHYELLACFGANGFGPESSFAEKLLLEMRAVGCAGRLTALKGATNIGKGQGRQTGSSRFSTGWFMWRKGGTDPNGPTTNDSKVTWDI